MAKKAEKKFSAHYISGTHWDREWYRPFQEFRMLLVELIDVLLDLMEKKGFPYFHLDSQTCVLNDYIEVRPENRERLGALIKDGRILVGPWYTMPDLFCPDGESFIRNLLLGRRICSEWGVKPMPVAYTCDMFGHISQMPQIYNGFGLEDCIVGRGTNENTTPMYFYWEAPNGSKVFTFKLQDTAGYASFVGIRNILEKPDAKRNKEEIEKGKEWLKKYVGIELERATAPVLLLIDALDHMLPAKDAAWYLELVEEVFPQIKTVHSTLPAFFAEAHEKTSNVPSIRGELREPSRRRHSFNWLIPNCVSARVRMKQANDLSQMLLEKWAEPLTAIANSDGASLVEQYLKIAWEFVVASHAHDSICGCSIDQVHRDMMYRFDQARIIANQQRIKAFGAMTAQCADLAKEKDEFTVTIFNPVPVRRREVMIFDIHLPKDFPTSFYDDFGGSQKVLSFTLEDTEGKNIQYQRLAVLPSEQERSRYANHIFMVDSEFGKYTVAAELELPPMGFTSLIVKPCQTAIRTMGSLRTSPTTAENEHLIVEVQPNGTIALTDKSTGEKYTDLLIFEDRSEIGDGWFHTQTVTDEIALSTACPAQVSVVNDGPEAVTFRIAVKMNIPKCYDWLLEKRSDIRIDMQIVSLVTLRRGAKTVEVETKVENNALDHRLRLLMPTDVKAKTYLAHHPFDFVERKIELDPTTVNGQEIEVAEKPFLGIQSVGAGKRGLAFLSAGGLHEGGITDDKRRTMLVTLFRAFRRVVASNYDPDGQEQGLITYRYALMPFAGTLPRIEALNILDALQAGIITRQTGGCSSGYPAMKGKDKPVKSFIDCTSNKLIISTIKPRESGGGMVVRLWNPMPVKAKETIAFWKNIKKAERLMLSEEPADGTKPIVQGNKVGVEAGPHEIVTIGISF